MCVSITILALYPYQQLPLLRQVILLITISAWSAMSGLVGGYLGAIAPTGYGRGEWRECSAIGGSVTGSLWVSSQALISLFLSPGIKAFDELGSVVGFCLLLAGMSFVFFIPYIFIWPLFVGGSKLIRFGREFHLSYVLISGSVWAGIGFLAGTKMLTDANIIGGLVQGGIMGLCGACGGWAIGQFRADA